MANYVGQAMFRYQGFASNQPPDLIEPEVLRVTPKGCWVKEASKPGDLFGFSYTPDSRARFVLSGSTKRHAHETKQVAFQSYIRRLGAQIRILKSQLESAQMKLRHLGPPPE